MVNMVKLQQAAGILTEQSLSRLNALLEDKPPKSESPEGGGASEDPPSGSVTTGGAGGR
jgi:hypothetical protein